MVLDFSWAWREYSASAHGALGCSVASLPISGPLGGLSGPQGLNLVLVALGISLAPAYG